MSDLELEDDDQPDPSSSQDTSSDSSPPPSSPPKKQPVRSDKHNLFLYDGRTGQVYKIWFLNMVMNILTLGVYSFWGKTRLRKYVAGGFLLDNDRFEYTGTGMELFLGFLKAIPIFIMVYAPFMVASFIGGEDALWPLVFILPIFFIFGVARFAALRFRVSRTRWRGIRGILDGSALNYGVLSFWRMVINIVTLGIAIPYSDMAKHRYIMMRLYFGNVPIDYEGRVGHLMKSHIITLLLAPFTLGMSRLWYQAALAREKMNGMSAGNIRFENTVTGGGLLKHVFLNLLILLFTLGIGMPVVMQRNMKFLVWHTRIIGDLETSEIMQAKDQKITVGEGLDDAFGLDTGLM